MDLAMKEFLIDSLLAEDIDMEYEFDAPKYYDFTRPEIDLEDREAHLWFEYAGSYSPSPFVMELDWQPSIQVICGLSSVNPNVAENINPTGVDLNAVFGYRLTSADKCTLGVESYGQSKSPTESPSSKHSNFMSPTASQLAKQNHTPNIYCERLLRRSEKTVKTDEKSSQSYSLNGTCATKRQKLEAGYLFKVAHLKHQAVLLHKASRKVGMVDIHTALPKTNVTVPKEPNLETSFRAKKHRSKVNLESAEYEKSNSYTFRARPLNRKILESPSFPLPKKSTPRLPEFQLFHLRTSERAMQHASVNVANASKSSPISQNEATSSRRINPVATINEKLSVLDTVKARCLNKKECNFPTDKRLQNEPPIDLFNKLSLTSEVRSKMPSHSKGLKENAPASLHLQNEMKNVAKSQRHVSNPFHCRSSQTMPSFLPKVNRSVDIR